MIRVHRYQLFWVLGALLLTITGWAAYTHWSHTTSVLEDDLATYFRVGETVQHDLTKTPALAIREDYTITDVLKDGITISYGIPTAHAASQSQDLGANNLTSDNEGVEVEPLLMSEDPSVTQETLQLQFPETLAEPLTVTLPGNRTVLVHHEVAEGYESTLLTRAQADTDPISTVAVGGESSADELATEDTAPRYLKYSAADDRTHTYYAYQKDQAAGARTLKHWTIYTAGSGEETVRYRFEHAKLSLNNRGEVEVRAWTPEDQKSAEVKDTVDSDLWARAQAVLERDLAADLENRPPDFTIPAPYVIDAHGKKTVYEWEVGEDQQTLTSTITADPASYPLALDPTLEFTAPGVSNAGDYITGEEGTSGYFGASLATGDWNGDGKDDLAVGAYRHNSNQGRAYIFYGGSMTDTAAGSADVIMTGETTNNYFGISLATGDWNSDGTDDLAVGAYGYNSSQGRAYLFYGGSMTDTGAGSADVIFTGEASGNSFGRFFTTGDFNADGTDDLAVGANTHFSSRGRAYIFYGGSMTNTGAGSADVTFTGEELNDNFGYSLATGDYNADGTDDLAVGAFGYNGGVLNGQGRAYIFYGGSMTDTAAGSADVIMTGETTNNYFGISLATGDFNTDGTDDLAVGASGYNSFQGRAYIFYGGSLVSTSASNADIIFTGEAISNNFGISLATGDFNADGTDDLAVGAYGYNSSQGRAYLFYGGSMTNTGAGSADVIFTGEATSNNFGWSLATGDWNSDGTDDLAVGASGYNSSQGRAYIFYSQSGQVNLNEHITGETAGDYFGSSFATGDFNNDGREDLAVGAPNYNSDQGRVYIFYNDGFYPSLASTSDVVLTGEGTGDYFGGKITTGDLNGDGATDFVVSALLDSTTYIFYGGSITTKNATGADVSLSGENSSDRFGGSIAVGDYNADGTDDLSVGAYFAATTDGRVYIFHGGALGASLSAGVDADVTITGESNSYFGYTLAEGNLNQDNKIDLVVGAYSYNFDQGRTYVFHGGALGASLSAGTDADVTFTGETNSQFGYTLSVADFNQNGTDDLAVGADGYNSSQGRAYIFYGGGLTDTAAGSADVTFTGEATSNSFGTSLTTGDFNADGTDDLAVGAYGYNTSQGRAYIFFNDGSYPAYASTSDITITGESANDDFGYALGVGDFNNDGKDDLVIGAPGYNNGGDTGRVYLYETKEKYSWDIQRQSLADGLRVDPLAGHELTITGETTSTNFGTAFALGDFNNDGHTDLAVGASSYNSNQGKVYLFYNTGEYPTKAGGADVTITGESGSEFGGALAVGDLNADGTDDLAVGAKNYNSQGRVYIFYGDGSMSTTASGADETISVGSFEQLGYVLSVGDYNADGTDDLAAGAINYSSARGAIYIFYNDGTYPTDVTSADVRITGEATFNYFGSALTTGDYNADGTDDLAVGAYGYNSNQGRAYIFYNDGAYPAGAGSADIILTGEATTNFFSFPLTTGDFNNDGKDDLVVSATGYDSYKGRVYIFHGGSMVSENASGANVILTGESVSNNFGRSLATSDFNADGAGDLAVGAVGYNSSQGRAYLFYNATLAGTVTATSADIILTGEASSNSYGIALAAGDLNNDGQDDLLVGATGYNSSQGKVYLYTTNDRVITGAASSDNFGQAFATGDFNSDGKNDLAVGANGYNSDQGRVYIFYGGDKATTSATGADVIFTGEGTFQDFGYSLTTGDFNSDGTDDLAVGAYFYSSDTGRVYLFYGGSMTDTAAGSADVTFTGESTNHSFGYSLTRGDYNADGTDDLAVGAFHYNNWDGRAYIFYGGSMSDTAAGSADAIFTGETFSYFGHALMSGDYNRDGIDDLAVSGHYYNSQQGRAYIFHGSTSLSNVGAASADVIFTGESTSDLFGASLTTGDFNADGTDDFAVGASHQDSAYIFYGGSMTNTAAGSADAIFTGESSTDFGISLTTGDLNKDGQADLVVGASTYNSSQGRAYLFYGGGTFPENAADADVLITGENTNNSFGAALISADLNEDGTDDLVIGADGYDVGSGTNEGRVYIITSEAATLQLSSHRLQGTIKFQGTGQFR